MSMPHLHRLDGLEPDNLLAFLALLGLLRAIESGDRSRSEDRKLFPRACWDLDAPPLRPTLVLRSPLSRAELLEALCRGIDSLAQTHDFDGRKDLNFARSDSRSLLETSARSARAVDRHQIDLLAALMSDGAFKEKDETIDPTPLCLLFGQGHQHFLHRLAAVPAQATPVAKRGVPQGSASDCIEQALFAPWHRRDDTFSFRWDPAEDVRYAFMAGDPTDDEYKTGTQHGANRLAAIGIAALSVVPEVRLGRARPAVLGGSWSRRGFAFSWPIWREPASLAAIRGLLSHPGLQRPSELAHLSVEHVMTARRISVGKFMNFTRAREQRDADGPV